MKKIIFALCGLFLAGAANAAGTTLLTVNIDIKDAKCTYKFFKENDKIKYEADPINVTHCPRTLDMSKSIDDVDVLISLQKIPIEGKNEVCYLQVNKRTANSDYVYSFTKSPRGCSSVVNVKLDTPH